MGDFRKQCLIDAVLDVYHQYNVKAMKVTLKATLHNGQEVIWGYATAKQTKRGWLIRSLVEEQLSGAEVVNKYNYDADQRTLCVWLQNEW